MKAILCDEFGEINQLSLGQALVPEPASDQVLIKVDHCGVNFPDTLIVQGKYQFKPQLPFSPGGEVSGSIERIGSDVSGFKRGDKVLAAMGWGGFAEYALASGSNTFLMPEKIDGISACALLETYATALHALKDRGALMAGERLLVLGAAGGTGTAAIQLGKLFGAKVLAIASTDEKRAFALANGADEVLDPQNDVKTELKELGGVDVIFDPVGGSLSEKCFRAINPGGRHLVVGFASGEIPALPFNLPLLKNASITGVFWGQFWRNQAPENRRNVRLLLKWLSEKKIKPAVTRRYPLSEAIHALDAIVQRTAMGKIVLEV